MQKENVFKTAPIMRKLTNVKWAGCHLAHYFAKLVLN
jgi:hypothetical protein